MKETYRKIDRHQGERWALTSSGLAFIGEPFPESPLDEYINEQTTVGEENESS